jgi:tetratricopeptide (TPR) repeat protein
VLAGAGLGLWGLRPVPFVGRQAERDRLWRELGAVRRDGRARAVLLHGAAGSGKSRIAEWIAERAHETGAATVLEAVHSPMAGPAEGLPRMVARFLRCQGLQGDALAAQAERTLRRLGSEDAAEALGLARLMGGGDASGAGEAQSTAERHALVARLLRRAARERPVIVVLDDVQWGRDALAFCARALRDAEPLPALFLLTAREEALAGRADETALLASVIASPGASRLPLAPLPAADHRRLVEQLLGLDSALVRQVEERTEGNPLFAVQLVGDWVQRGVLQAGPGGFVLPAGETAPLPEDIHQVWAEHIHSVLRDRPLAYRTALEVAAALGLAVERGEWVAACRAAGVEPPAGLIDTLARRRLARRTDEGYSFVHGMLRESVERLAREGGRWTAHHLACAEVLRPRYAAGERGAAERLARHLLVAERPAQAVDPLLRAAAERRQTSDYPRAHVLLERRDREMDAAGLPVTDPRRGEGWVLRARVFLHEGRLDAVSEWAGRARREAEAHGWTRALSESLRLLGDAARRRGDLDPAAALYQDCVALLGRLDDPHGVAGSLWGLGDVHRQRGRLDEAQGCFVRSRELYQRIHDAHGVADHSIGEADVAWQRGDLRRAAEHYGRAMELFRALGNRYGVARSLNGLGEVDRSAGRLAEARGRYEEALRLLDLVQSADALFPRVNLGFVALAARQWDEARSLLLPVVDELQGLGWRGLLTTVHAALLAGEAVRGDWEAWDTRFAQAALGAQSTLEPDLAWALTLAGEVAAASDAVRAERAATLARTHWRALRRQEGPGR